MKGVLNKYSETSIKQSCRYSSDNEKPRRRGLICREGTYFNHTVD